MSNEGWVVWLTGLPASGKSTIGRHMQAQLKARNIPAVLLDSDELRLILTPMPTYSTDERATFYSQVVEIAILLARQGMNVIIAATANRRSYRELARQRLDYFCEVWVDCPLAVCKGRDPKGHYAHATKHEDSTLPGIGTIYEPPEQPAAVIRTDQIAAEAAAMIVIQNCGLTTDQTSSIGHSRA